MGWALGIISNEDKDGWTVIFHGERYGDDRREVVKAETAPLAICLAALRLVGG
jgi:hypothetical protein